MYQGFYINLERDRQKRDRIEKNVMSIGLFESYSRCNAVDGTEVAQDFDSQLMAGELGCWLSHLSILHGQMLKGRHIHVIEDDALLHRDIAKVFSGFTRQVAEWDVLFTDFFVPYDLYLFKSMHEALLNYKQNSEIRVLKLDEIKFACANSYFVHKDSIRKLYKLLSNCGRENMPLDLKLRDAANSGEISAYATLPFFSTLSEYCQNSSIRTYDKFRRAFDLYRHSFYVDADLQQLSEMLDRCGSACGQPDRQVEVFLKLSQILCDRNYVKV